MNYDIENLFVRNILGLSDNAEVNLDKEIQEINNKVSKRTSMQRSELLELYKEIRK